MKNKVVNECTPVYHNFNIGMRGHCPKCTFRGLKIIDKNNTHQNNRITHK